MREERKIYHLLTSWKEGDDRFGSVKRADKYRILVVVVLVADATNASNTISLTARGKARDSLVAFDRSSLLLLKRLEDGKGRPFAQRTRFFSHFLPSISFS